jgi:iron complex transport system substrate-binding protein
MIGSTPGDTFANRDPIEVLVRVASLIASATEIVSELGFGDSLVARSHECDWPPAVRSLPAITEPKIDVQASSAAIDREVKALVEEALSVYRVDAERLRDLTPDLVVTQTQCEVCAVSLSDVERALAEWTGNRPRVVSLEPNALEDVWADVGRVAAALGVPARGEELVAELRGRMDDVAARAAALPDRPRVACIEWIDPLMAAGNWMPELVAMAGGENLFGEPGKHSPWMSWEELVEADPDVLVVMPCGFDVQRSRAEMGPLLERPEWGELRAVRAGRVAVADGVQYMNRPGPRVAESLEILAEILHPAAFGDRWRGTGWEPL